MAINPALLVADSTLQDYLVDKDTGLPLTNGTLTFYQDNSRTTLKNVYYQVGNVGNYSYVTFPNPLDLGAAGTIVDNDGNDAKLFYYPFSEADNATPQAYYITCVNSAGKNQFVRQDWPPGGGGSLVPANQTVTFRNLISNSEFWRNAGTVNLTTPPALPSAQFGSGFFGQVICPDQHDGFTMPHMIFAKNATGATDSVAFTAFTSTNRLPTDVTPEFYMNVSCGNSGSSETSKYIQIPIQLHLDNLNGFAIASFVMWTQNVGGSANNNITVKLLGYNGTGVAAASPAQIGQVITPGSSWVKTVFAFNFPITTLPVAGSPGDDAWYLQLYFPNAVQFNMNIAMPAIYLSAAIPTNEFKTYDQIDSLINVPHTGDIVTTINPNYRYGWVPMNDGTLGNASSNATSRANNDSWQLFNMLWTAFQPYDTGSNSNPICQMYNSSSVATNYGASAIADFNANKQLALTKMMGKILMGTVPASQLLTASSTITGYMSGITFSNSAGNLLVTTNTSNLLGIYKGGVVIFTAGGGGTLPTGVTANTLYYAVPQSSTTFLFSTSFANAMAGTVVAVTGGNTGTAPENAFCFPAGSFAGEYNHTQLVAELAAHTHNFACNHDTNNTVTVTFNGAGAGQFNTATASTGSSTPFNVTQPSTYMNFWIKL